MHVKFRRNIKTLCLECCKSTITNMAKKRNIEVTANKRKMYTLTKLKLKMLLLTNMED
jgi:hypothetical protein